MPDLGAAIRTRLDSQEAIIKGADNGTLRVLGEADQWEAALIAALDKHADDTIGDGPAHCRECSSLAGVRVWAPCGTVRAIAKELGVETDG